ncbi:hypothetical protein EC973_005632 [Apophysomyces ossiformis]|uniref:Methyltransferase-domain-containing protein n=1 Tax=Apophysomyces ossiformis TaxID=679940 RepID=A0A8H7BK93_9FUNG|nr:hypothetical protein EC973_005632 [Apophysomyces ossiformis]
MILKQNVPSTIGLGKWIRVEVELVTEMGLPLEPCLAKSCNFVLDCAVLEKDRMGSWQVNNKSRNLIVRCLTGDPWATELSRADWPGFYEHSQGGFEFKILQNTFDDEIQNGPIYIYIRSSPKRRGLSTPHVLPLAIGPISLKASSLPEKTNVHPEPGVGQSQQIHRVLGYPVGQQLKYFLVKERWGCGTPGKLWDAALVLASMFAKACSQHPDCFNGTRIVDMSAGTGFIGLFIAHLLKVHQAKQIPDITLTDIAEALRLIEENHDLNTNGSCQQLAKIETLAWGEKSHAERVKRSQHIDIVIASDLLYNVCDFASIISTLIDLSTPGRTVIYLGYKRRGFKGKDEAEFFRLCKPYFHISLANGPQKHLVDWEKRAGCLSIDWHTGSHSYAPETVHILSGLLREQGIRIYRLVRRMDGQIL